MIYAFGDCVLDARLYELRRGGEVCHVEPQVFNVLLYLLEHREEVVTKEELLEAVWGNQFVSEATLSSRIMAARKAIGDDGDSQKYIRTVRGRGFRFIGDVEVNSNDKTPNKIIANTTTYENETISLTASIRTVGREAEMRHLRQRLEAAKAGQRQVIFVTGEAGIGKTTLLQSFLEEATSKNDVCVLRGQCLDHHGTSEPYMPLLTALAQLCRGAQGERVVALLTQCAPTWLVQMPWLVDEKNLEALRQRTTGATRDRMLREIVEVLEALSAERPLIIVLEDLHWSDYSTLDVVSMLARRPETARLFVIGTYRLADAQSGSHPLRTLAQELRIRGYCAELALSFLTPMAVSEYLQARFPGLENAPEIAALLHSRTNGNPLFLHHMVEFWRHQNYLTHDDSGWKLQVTSDQLGNEVPSDLRHLIEQQLEQLPLEDRQLLEKASVAGAEFSAAVLAVNAEQTVEEIEQRCIQMARQGLFLSQREAVEWPDGTFAEQFAFTHHLYPEVLYARISAGQRARVHCQIGERLEAGYQHQTKEIAPELALHFLRGRDAKRAVLYLRQAAEQALGRNAFREAAEHMQNALQVLAKLPECDEKARCELELLTLYAPTLVALNGWMIPEAEQLYQRACELSQQLSEPVELASALYGLGTIYEIRGDYKRAEQLVEERMQIIQADSHSMLQAEKMLLESHELMACSLQHQGRFEQALHYADEGLKYYSPEWYSESMAAIGENAGVACHAWASLALWYMGRPHQAVVRMHTAIEMADLPNHTFSQASVLTQAGVLHQLRGEVEKVRQYAKAALEVAELGGFSYRIAIAHILEGWAQAVQGEHAAGLEKMQKGLRTCHSTGVFLDFPYYLGLRAQVYGWAGQFDEGLNSISEALSVVQRSEHFFCQPELYRLRGKLLLLCGEQQKGEECYELARETAREIKSNSLELRVAISMSELWQQQGRHADAHRLLSESLGHFNEGFDSYDLVRAKALLDSSILK